MKQLYHFKETYPITVNITNILCPCVIYTDATIKRFIQ